MKRKVKTRVPRRPNHKQPGNKKKETPGMNGPKFRNGEQKSQTDKK